MNPKIEISQLLTTIVLKISGTDSHAWEIIVDDSWHKTGSGDSTVTTSLFGVGSHTAVLWIAGFQVATVSYIETEVIYTPEPVPPTPPPPPPPEPPQPGEVNLGSIGTSCVLYGTGTNGNFYYQVRKYDGENITSWHKDMSEVSDAGTRDSRCQEIQPPPPPTTSELADRISGTENGIRALNMSVEGIVGAIEEVVVSAEEEAASWRAGLDTAITGLRDSLTAALSSAVGVITTRLDNINDLLDKTYYVLIPEIWINLNEIAVSAETEAAAWRKGVLDLDASLKAWISAGILDLVWAAITRDEEER